MPRPHFTPGTHAPRSGQYQQVGPRGGTVGRPEVTITRGEPFPPTPEKGGTFILVDPTQHSK